jgi:flagellar biosynthesis chaperone FliJ
MPCKECKDGKYKWGNTGECKYATKDECEKANPKKYSKMQPTPLGKKTYAEYEKELKEFNLSSQRFDFNSIKVLEKLASQMDKVVNQLENDYGQIQMLINDYDNTEELVKEQSALTDRAEDGVALATKDVEAAKKMLVASEKSYDNAFNKLDKLAGRRNKAEDKLVGRNEKYKDAYARGEDLKVDLKSAIKSVEQQLKQLGVSQKPDELERAEIAIKLFDAEVPDAAKKLGY